MPPSPDPLFQIVQTIENDADSEPAAIGTLDEMQRRRPVGLVYIWPETRA